MSLAEMQLTFGGLPPGGAARFGRGQEHRRAEVNNE